MKKKLLALFLCLGMSGLCFVSPMKAKADTVQAAVTAVKLNKSVIMMKVGQYSTLKATIHPLSSNYLTVKFKSSNSNISLKKKSRNTVTVTGKKVGESTITAVARATGSNVDVTAKCKVIVTNKAIVAPKSVKITSDSKKSSKTIYAGKTCTLKATVSPSNATNKNITWKSSNLEIATIDSKGKVTGKAKGTATITATVTGTKIKSTYKIIVKDRSIQLSTTAVNIAVGEEYEIEVKKLEPTTSKVVWKSSDTNYVTVNSMGMIKGIKEGTAVVTARIYGTKIQTECKVNVK